MFGIDTIFAIIILVFSVVIHEVSHGYAADRLGDPTARYAGRLTLNPIKHLSLFGSFLIPLLTYSIGGFIFGWAKPVPYNPYNLKHKYGDAIVAVAGPASNFLVAIIFGLVVRLNMVYGFVSLEFINVFMSIVFINIILAVFNLVPIPPLDGSKILFSMTSYKYPQIGQFLERNGMLLLVIFIFFFWKLLLPVITFMFSLITGI